MLGTKLVTFISFASASLALAVDVNDGSIHIPLTRRAPRAKSPSELKAFRDSVVAKFTPNSAKSKRENTLGVPNLPITNLQNPAKAKRASTVGVPITNFDQDAGYFAEISIGTPGTKVGVILDTGSSDLWVATPQCQCAQNSVFNPSSSSSLQQSQQSLQLTYGQGQVTGTLAEDTVSIAGLTIPKQEFVLANQVQQIPLQGDLSGLLGLAFQTIAVSQATPLVQALAQGNQLSSQEMAFFLDRLIDDVNAPDEAPGGTFTIGGTNSSLFQGSIDFVDIPSNVQPSFWLLPVTAIGVQGSTLTANTQSLAAIDTGTTTIGGPTDVVAEIYSKIQGSQALTGDMEGFFAFPCSTNVQTSFTFSSKTWSINPVDFIVQQIDNTNCLGAIFGVDIGSQGGPDWIIGDTFLKNVYSVFRFSPGPSIGFAQLANNLEPSPSASGPASTHTAIIPTEPLPSFSPASTTGTNSESNPFGSPSSTSGSSSTSPSSNGAAVSFKNTEATIGMLCGFIIAFVSGLWIL